MRINGQVGFSGKADGFSSQVNSVLTTYVDPTGKLNQIRGQNLHNILGYRHDRTGYDSGFIWSDGCSIFSGLNLAGIQSVLQIYTRTKTINPSAHNYTLGQHAIPA
jgi:hypothetical protein